MPGRVKDRNGETPEPERIDLQHDRLPDPNTDMLRHLTARVIALESTVAHLHLEDDGRTADAWVESGGSHI